MNKITGNEPIAIDENYGNVGAPGLTIRQEFASRAMQGLLASVDPKDFESVGLVKASVRIADELITALNGE